MAVKRTVSEIPTGHLKVSIPVRPQGGFSGTCIKISRNFGLVQRELEACIEAEEPSGTTSALNPFLVIEDNFFNG